MPAIASESPRHATKPNPNTPDQCSKAHQSELSMPEGRSLLQENKISYSVFSNLNSCCHKCHHIRWYHMSYRSQDRYHSPPIWLGPQNTVKNITSWIGPLRSTYQNLLLPAFPQIICCFLHQCNNHDGWIKMADRTTSTSHWHWWVNKHQGESEWFVPSANVELLISCTAARHQGASRRFGFTFQFETLVRYTVT